ncbi:peptidoglycan DD-metalloendopeptidase family protein [Flavobacteriaceae bacterium]|nr:peptidoglycan DD-metalloendopeptidase family protein [Flavobacteriaceae bacterium]MDC1492365.1 peptidoglycan DD-metalloendopeptidase family protein [Flavobacteriaceae bacterium]
MNRPILFIYFVGLAILYSCGDEKVVSDPIPENIEFGFNIDNFKVKRDTIKRGDSFGEIMEKNKIGYPKIYNITNNIKDTFDVRWLTAGKPFTILSSKDSLETPLVFIYQPNKVNYVVIHIGDSIHAYNRKKPVTIVKKYVSGEISSSLSETMDGQGLPYQLINDMSDIYAWTIDFFRLQKGDKFKIIYNERFIEDSIYAGIKSIDAAYFEHNNESFYAFNYKVDSLKKTTEYYDEKTQSLQRTFLRAPVQFSNVSSRYNLKRKIAYYGNKVKAHKGTDFAAPVGTEILATADGRVIESRRKGGNGNYVKIKHNSTYSTQYLHMKKRLVKVGQYVKQGEVIGQVGMTGNTSGPHVCYRFWKNGKQVDPYKQKLPIAKSVPKSHKKHYQEFIMPIKQDLDNIQYNLPPN